MVPFFPIVFLLHFFYGLLFSALCGNCAKYLCRVEGEETKQQVIKITAYVAYIEVTEGEIIVLKYIKSQP